jgi:hypothetical protein
MTCKVKHYDCVEQSDCMDCRHDKLMQQTFEMPYIEIVSGIGVGRRNLNEADLRHIGKFTRWSVAQWLYNQSPEGGIDDFHAVFGDIDIPWATEAARLRWAQWSKEGDK